MPHKSICPDYDLYPPRYVATYRKDDIPDGKLIWIGVKQVPVNPYSGQYVCFRNDDEDWRWFDGNDEPAQVPKYNWRHCMANIAEFAKLHPTFYWLFSPMTEDQKNRLNQDGNWRY